MSAESCKQTSAPVNEITLPYNPDSAVYAQVLANLPYFIWLDSSTDPNQGRYDLLTAKPTHWIEIDGGCLHEYTAQDGSYRRSRACEHATARDFFDSLQKLLDKKSIPPTKARPELPFTGGLMGYVGYNLGNYLYGIPSPAAATTIDLPDAAMGYYTWAIVVDHKQRKASIIYIDNDEAFFNHLETELNAHASSRQSQTSDEGYQVGAFNGHLPQAQYKTQLKKVHDYIQAGDCYQVNFTHCFSADFSGSTFSAYCHLRKALPSPFSAYIQLSTGAVLSVSPERLLSLHGSTVEARPIKGTISRGKTFEEDEFNVEKLKNSEKDQAENLMIVDLLRNDISKVCEPFSVKVPELFSLESYTNVHHLVSSITGELKATRRPLDLLEACFPGGSITGAPKKRAMEIISELENTERSVYCGSIGYISLNGNMDTNIAIRSVVYDGNKIHCWGGGGIVADSNDQQEFEESLHKIQLIMDTLTTPR